MQTSCKQVSIWLSENYNIDLISSILPAFSIVISKSIKPKTLKEKSHYGPSTTEIIISVAWNQQITNIIDWMGNGAKLTQRCWKTLAKRTVWSRYLGQILGFSQQIVALMNLLRVSQMRAERYWEAFDCWAKAQCGSIERWHRWGPIYSSVCASDYTCD